MEGEGWIATNQLQVGMKLQTINGTAVITDLRKERTEEEIPVYNFRVSEWSSYFVSEWNVYVHNGKGYKRGSGTLKGANDTFDDWLKEMSPEDRARYLKNLNEIEAHRELSTEDYYKLLEDNFYHERIASGYYNALEPSLPTGSKPVGIYDQRNLASVLHQNESANFLADKGYNVKMLDEIPGGNGYGIKSDSNPDFYIENTVFDCYAPDTNKSKNVIKELYDKTKKQATHIVLNLDDYSGDTTELLGDISKKSDTKWRFKAT